MKALLRALAALLFVFIPIRTPAVEIPAEAVQTDQRTMQCDAGLFLLYDYNMPDGTSIRAVKLPNKPVKVLVVYDHHDKMMYAIMATPNGDVNLTPEQLYEATPSGDPCNLFFSQT